MKKDILVLLEKSSPRLIDFELITENTKIMDDLGLDSIAIVNLILAVEEHFNIEFPESEDFTRTFFTITTLEKRILELE